MSDPSTPPPTQPDPSVLPSQNETEGDGVPPTRPVSQQREDKDPLRGSRTSGIWAAVVALVVLLVLLAIFVLQNVQSVEVSFLEWTGHPPLAAALLIATAGGALIAVVAGSLRLLQLRRRVRRDQRRVSA